MQDLFEHGKFKEFNYLVRRCSKSTSAPYIFVLHGYGANAQDLAPLAHYFDSQKKWNWVFIQAPIELTMPMANARAWFPIDEQALQRTIMRGVPRDFASQRVEGLQALISNITELIESVSNGAPVILSGFSQGAMMSFHLHHKVQNLKGLILMSGAAIDLESFQPRKENTSVLITHGTQDPVVDYGQAQICQKVLMKMSHYNVDLCSFAGAHEIGPSALDKISNFLKAHLGNN